MKRKTYFKSDPESCRIKLSECCIKLDNQIKICIHNSCIVKCFLNLPNVYNPSHGSLSLPHQGGI